MMYMSEYELNLTKQRYELLILDLKQQTDKQHKEILDLKQQVDKLQDELHLRKILNEGHMANTMGLIASLKEQY